MIPYFLASLQGMDESRPCLLLYFHKKCCLYGDPSWQESAEIETAEREIVSEASEMSVLDCLESVARAVHPPCAKCLYRLGLVKFVTSPCPACRLDGYRMYDILMRRQSAAHFVPLGRNLWGGQERFDLTELLCYRGLKDTNLQLQGGVDLSELP